MSDVAKCTGRKCRGTYHEPACAKYITELALLAAKKNRKRSPDDRKRHDEVKGRTDEEKAEDSRRNGAKGGRPPGSPNLVPYGAVAILRKARLGIRKEFSTESIGEEQAGAVGELAGYALERTVQVLGGSIKADKAGPTLKAAKQIRDELCNPVITKVDMAGQMTLEQVVAAAAEKVAGGK